MSNIIPLKLVGGDVERMVPGETISPSVGGTGIESYTLGDILFAAGASQLQSLPAVATGNVLLSMGLLTPPAYGKVNLSLHITGTLSVTNGGTGLSSYVAGSYIKAATSSTLIARTPSEVILDIQAAAAVHAHSANDITTGILAPARLGTGTPDNTTFLRGDGIWFVLPTVVAAVTSLSIVNANGISGTVTPTITPQITLALGAITPSSVNAVGSGSFGSLTIIGDNILGSTVGTVTQIGAIGAFTTFAASTAATTPSQVIASVDGSIYRSGEFRIQAYNSTSSRYHTATILVVHNGIIATFTEFGDIDIGGRCADYTVDYSGGNFRILTTPNLSTPISYKIVANLTKV